MPSPAASETGRTEKGRNLLVLDESADDGVWCRWWISADGRKRIPLGAHPQNTGGKPGRSGPKTKKFKALCRHITNHPKLLERFVGILEYGDNKELLGMVKELASYVHSKPTQTHAIATSSLEDLLDASRAVDSVTPSSSASE